MKNCSKLIKSFSSLKFNNPKKNFYIKSFCHISSSKLFRKLSFIFRLHTFTYTTNIIIFMIHISNIDFPFPASCGSYHFRHLSKKALFVMFSYILCNIEKERNFWWKFTKWVNIRCAMGYFPSWCFNTLFSWRFSSPWMMSLLHARMCFVYFHVTHTRVFNKELWKRGEDYDVSFMKKKEKSQCHRYFNSFYHVTEVN